MDQPYSRLWLEGQESARSWAHTIRSKQLCPLCSRTWLWIPWAMTSHTLAGGRRSWEVGWKAVFFFFFSWSWHKNSRHACRWQRIARGAFSSGGLGQQTADAGTGSSLPLASRTPGKGATACTSATNSQEAVSIALSATVTTGSANTELGGLSPAL